MNKQQASAYKKCQAWGGSSIGLARGNSSLGDSSRGSGNVAEDDPLRLVEVEVAVDASPACGLVESLEKLLSYHIKTKEYCYSIRSGIHVRSSEN